MRIDFPAVSITNILQLSKFILTVLSSVLEYFFSETLPPQLNLFLLQQLFLLFFLVLLFQFLNVFLKHKK
jgi:hypothetical protein